MTASTSPPSPALGTHRRDRHPPTADALGARRAPTAERRPRQRGIAFLEAAAIVVVSLSTACSEPPPPELADIPQPALEAMEPAVRSQLETKFSEVEALRQAPAQDPEALAQGYGDLGRLSHAYQL